MKLTDYTDYTLRVLIFLGLHAGERVTIQQIADGYGISKNHLMKIIQQLGQAGWVDPVRGRNGGVTLAKPPAEIRIGAIVRETEGDFRLVECFDEADNRCVLSLACRLRGAMHQALEAFFAVLDGLTLADILENAPEVRPLVGEFPLVYKPRANPAAAAATKRAVGPGKPRS